MADRRSALVTDAERGSAVATIRSLDRAGWRVVAVSADRRAPGLHARGTSATLVHAAPATEPGRVVEQLREAVEEHGCQLVFPITDQMVRLARRAALPPSTVVASAPPPAYDAASDKWRTVEAAQRLGVPVPPSELASSMEEVHAAVSRIGWPMVLKPRFSVTEGAEGLRRHDVTIVERPSDLPPVAERQPVDVIVQQFHPGVGVGVELLLDRGRLIAGFQHRRLREYPVRGGPSSFRQGERLDPDLLAWSISLLEELGWTGLAMVEFKVGPGGPALMEINGRVWGSMPLAITSGVDFPSLAAAVHLGQELPTGPLPYRVGLRSRDLRLELMWIAAVLRGGATLVDGTTPRRARALGVAARLFLPGDGHDVLALDDPRASAAEISQALRHIAAKIRSSA